MAAQSNVQTAENFNENAHVYSEGMIAGLIGALAIAVWFLILDSFQGRPLQTPSILGTALFRDWPGAGGVLALPISYEMVLTFTWIHGMVFVAIGVAAAWLLTLAERDPNYGIGVLFLFVIFEFGFIAVGLIFAGELLEALTLPAILIGNLIAAAAMGVFFRMRHPSLTIHP